MIYLYTNVAFFLLNLKILGDHVINSLPFIFWLNKATVMSFLFQLASLSQKSSAELLQMQLYNAQVLK